MPLCLGKTPARPDAIKLKLRHYLSPSQLPTPPVEFGHDALVTQPWGVLGNDKWGCCVFSGGAHETMLWNKEAGIDVEFNDTVALGDYSAVTGFAFTDDTDQGTDMQAAAKYRQNTGLLDISGKRHKIGAYLEIQKGNFEEHLLAMYLFGVVGVGIEFPQSAMTQFDAGQPWSLVQGSPIVGGHYIPCVARRGGMFVPISWGKELNMDDKFFAAQNDESIVYLSPEMMKGNISLDGFDLDQLTSDLKALQVRG